MTGGFPPNRGNSPPALAGEGEGWGSQGGGYYDYPVIRRPVWTWEVPAYFWLGGMGAGAFVTASLAQNLGSDDDRRVAADGFFVAAAALIPCAPLLIGDLGRPERFHHMLRIFKPLSPMNLGAWTLTGFTPLAFARAASQAADRGLLRGPLRALARLVPRRLTELAGSLLGLTLAGYSGVLLGATNVPLWAKSKLLGGLFMASALSSGSAAVTLQAARRGAPDATLHRLGTLESVASLGEVAVITGYLMQSGKAARPLTTGRFAAPFWVGAVGVGSLLPPLLHLFARRHHGSALRSLSTAASACALVGSLALRWSIFEAGKDSSEDQAVSLDFSKA
jgi:formate-dependent nitrite reductase membrane component NrfD